MLTGSHGTFCSGVALARDLVLTAAHCVQPGANYKLIEFDHARQPTLKDLAIIARHPDFDINAAVRHRVTADIALIKLAAPLKVIPAPLVRQAGPSLPVTPSLLRATGLPFVATAKLPARCALRRLSRPGSRGHCKSGSPIPLPKASARAWARAPVIPARRSIGSWATCWP